MLIISYLTDFQWSRVLSQDEAYDLEISIWNETLQYHLTLLEIARLSQLYFSVQILNFQMM